MPARLVTLPPTELEAVMLHPLQWWARGVVEELLGALRECDDWSDYSDFQRLLFQQLWQVESARGAVRRVVKRLNRNRGLPPTVPELPDGKDPHDPQAWKNEDRVHERVARQLRSVGDALAWRVTGFDRRYILALSRNDQAGPMAGKAGLGFELGQVVKLWDEDGSFALLHDLTSCLRIADLTEFTSDGGRWLHEVKRSGNATTAQKRRIHAALGALNEDGALPGTEARLVSVDRQYETQISYMKDALDLAERRGVVGMKVPGSRALIATNVVTMASETEPGGAEAWISRSEKAKRGALKRAGIHEDRHHLTMRTADWAARSPTAVPYGVYPLTPAQCADLICDLVSIEIVMSPRGLFESLTEHGFRTQMLLPAANGDLHGSQPMFRIAHQDRRLVIHAGMAAQLLAELIDLDLFVAAIETLLKRRDIPKQPVITFADESATWR